MLKIAAAILTLLLVFNWFGYQLVVQYLQHKADSKLEAKLDNNHYDESQLVEIKIALHLPYNNANSDYERYDGEIKYKGNYYKYVKRKIANDTLYLKCINNTGKTNLEIAKNDFFKNTNDLNQQNKKSQNSKAGIFKSITSDYDNYFFSLNVKETFSINESPFFGELVFNLPILSTLTPEQPPEFSLS